MKYSFTLLISMSILSLTFFVCLFPLRPKVFTLDEIAKLDKVDQIEIEVLEKKQDDIGYQARHIRTIRDPDEIIAIVEKARTYGNNWQNDGFGAMSPLLGLVSVSFYSEGEVKAGFGIGFTDEGIYYIRQFLGPGRYLTEAEFKELMTTIKVAEETAHYKR